MPSTRPKRQRLVPFAPPPPGTLLKRAFDTTQRLRLRAISERDQVYLHLVRQLPCLHCAMEPCEAAHVRSQSAAHGKCGGMGRKPADRWALPLCAEHHREQHRVGEVAFWSALGLNPLLICERLYAARGDPVAMRAVVLTAIGERRI